MSLSIFKEYEEILDEDLFDKKIKKLEECEFDITKYEADRARGKEQERIMNERVKAFEQSIKNSNSKLVKTMNENIWFPDNTRDEAKERAEMLKAQYAKKIIESYENKKFYSHNDFEVPNMNVVVAKDKKETKDRMKILKDYAVICKDGLGVRLHELKIKIKANLEKFLAPIWYSILYCLFWIGFKTGIIRK